MQKLAVVLALVLILVVAGSAAAGSGERLVCPPYDDPPPTVGGIELDPKVKEVKPVDDFELCPVPLIGPEMECPLELVDSLY